MSEYIPAPTGYVKALKDIVGYIRPKRCYTVFFEGSVPAGGETLVLELSGRGVIVLVNAVFWGASADVKHSRIVVDSDGETIEHVSPHEVGEVQMLDYGRGWSPKMFIHKWDDAAYAYGECLELQHSFREYAKLKVKNGDATNATNYRVLVMYGLEA